MIDLPNAQPTGKRRFDDFLFDQRLLRRHLRARRLQVRHVGIDVGLADGLRRKLFLIAFICLLARVRLPPAIAAIWRSHHSA